MADGSILIEVDLDTAALEQSMAEIGAALSVGTEQVSQWATEMGQGVGEALGAAVTEAIGGAGQKGAQAATALGQTIGTAGAAAMTAAAVSWKAALEAGLATAYTAFQGGAAVAAIQSALQAQAAVVRSSTLLSAAMVAMIQSAQAAAAAAASAANFSGIGANIAQGLAAGIRSNIGVVTAAAQAMVASVQAVTRNMLQIHSPSRWAMEIGRYIDEGLAAGIADNGELVLDSAGRMIADLQAQVALSAEDMLSIEMAALDEVIGREKAAQKERARAKEIGDRERKVSEAKTNSEIEKAREELSETLIKYEIEDMEQRRKLLDEEIKEFEAFRKKQAEIVKDVKYEEHQIVTEYYDLELERAATLTKEKVKLYDEEYIAKVRGIDEALAAALAATNAEIEAMIEKIALTDAETAARLAGIQEEKAALTQKNAAEKAAREARLYAEKEADYKRKIAEAETVEESMKRQEEYNDWKAEQDYKAAQKAREVRIKELEAEQKDVLRIAKETNAQLLEEAGTVRQATDESIKLVSEGIKNGTVDLTAEKEAQDGSLVQLRGYVDAAAEVRAEGLAQARALQTEYEQSAYSAAEDLQKRLLEMMAAYRGQWLDSGRALINSLVRGIESGFSALNQAVSYVLGKLGSLQDSGSVDLGGVPAYGRGGIVSSPHLAVVGDAPEAIIPLSRLPGILTAAMLNDSTLRGLERSEGRNGPVTVNQNIVIEQPVESPAEMARALKNVSRGLCYV